MAGALLGNGVNLGLVAARRQQIGGGKPLIMAAAAPRGRQLPGNLDISRVGERECAMPRRRAAPRLYLDPRRKTWIIRDGALFIRTGCAENERERAEKQLAEYLGQKWRPEAGPDPQIVGVLALYAKEHTQHTATARNSAYNLENLTDWWGTRRVSEVTAGNCRAYAQAASSTSMARRDLELLRAAIRHYSRSMGIPLQASVVLPPKAEPRSQWLTRAEAARLLWAARRTPHLARFILLGLATGSRARNLFGLKWDMLDLDAGVMKRRGYGEKEQSRKRTPRVRLGRKILGHLRRWKRRDGAAAWVVHFDGRPIKRFSTTWWPAVKRAGLGQDVTPHTLRHTRATWLLQRGVDPWQAAGHLGMTVGTLTRTYGHHSPDWQRDAAEV
jgi:integrase